MIMTKYDNFLFATVALLFRMFTLTIAIESLGRELSLGIDGVGQSDQNYSEQAALASLIPETLIMSETLTTATPITIDDGNTQYNGSLFGVYYTTESSANSSATTTASPAQHSLLTSGSENRLRWVDFRRPQSVYPPRMPAVHGIPSGFRNPLTPVFNPGMPQHLTGFGGSSTQPVGFGGSVVLSNHYGGPQANSVRRPHINITRVEHIAAECSDEYMKVTVNFNGTFLGLIYSSGYVHDPNCIYVNGTGRNRYEFFIRLNQCGTLGRQEMHHPTMPGEARRRDQLMWNTLSIQYNALIEEEWDEHFRVTCEYGSDFWRTVTFPSVNVEVNTGSPVVFTINPPQCQMEIRRGFGTSGTRTSGPVTVGDPLTLLIHMKSEKAGFDILVKNCIAHNGAQQRLTLIDSNGCVTNEKLISPFRGTYNADDGHQVSLYAYLKAFRFTGSPALYLECDIHMCHNKCPPQRCYWRNLSKRSADPQDHIRSTTDRPVVSESISLFQALEVRQEPEKNQVVGETNMQNKDAEQNNLCFRPEGVALFLVSMFFLLMLSTALSIGCCMRMRRIKQLHRHLVDSTSLYKNSYDNIYHESRFPFSRRF